MVGEVGVGAYSKACCCLWGLSTWSWLERSVFYDSASSSGGAQYAEVYLRLGAWKCACHSGECEPLSASQGKELLIPRKRALARFRDREQKISGGKSPKARFLAGVN
ncbi:hypothetical protein KIL84_015937 [Mauremys mutica]|uniref:Uncharacterized protein n=1 Tax=Mauremys mutica TaxID=74926 RepID=A0A9D3WU16_9SAUR|nr:hypothetical protein KIL84_015937 [Mauremys mutica]